jgi:1,2-diacylglycerol 3-beta-glucosyltransferase
VSLLGLLVLLAAVPVAVASAYLMLLALASGRALPPVTGNRTLRFDLIVPAHDEERGIGDTVRSLLGVDWPRDHVRVVVVADNCTDATADRAREAGAEVIERADQVRRGKGYALELAFSRSLEGLADGLVVVDADTVVSPNLLAAFAARLEAGAAAVQADYAVRNPNASWRTRLMAIALGAFHVERSAARERLGLSCGLRGNGMCFSRRVLEEVPHRAFSLVEDLEYGIRLGEAGHRVHYAGEAHVWGEMVAGERASRSQRQRWEGGRWQMAKAHGPRLLWRGLLGGDRILVDLAFDLLVPPVGQLGASIALGLALSAVARATPAGSLALLIYAGCGAGLSAYVLRGWALSKTGARGLLDLTLAPLYVVWKMTLSLRNQGPRGNWIRTGRQGERP